MNAETLAHETAIPRLEHPDTESTPVGRAESPLDQSASDRRLADNRNTARRTHMFMSLAVRLGLLTCLALTTTTWVVAQRGGGSPPADPALVFVELGKNGTKLSVMNADGARKTVLLTTPGLLLTPCWSPSGGSICFGIQIAGGAGLALLDVQVVNGSAVGSNFRMLVSGNWTKAAWSPDGSRIAFSNELWPGIWSVPAAGGTPTRLHAGEPEILWLAWSPDSSQIAFTTGLTGTVNVLDVALGLSFPLCSISGGTPSQVDWSRNGSAIVFHASATSGNGKFIYAVNATIGATPQLVASSSWFPTWSPDGAKIAYTTGSSDSIVVRDLQTGSVTSTGAKGRFANWRRF